MIVKENCNDFDPSNWLPKIKKRLKSTSEARNQLDITVPKNNKELKSDPNLRIQLQMPKQLLSEEKIFINGSKNGSKEEISTKELP